jgi:hypothetical protein
MDDMRDTLQRFFNDLAVLDGTVDRLDALVRLELALMAECPDYK